MEENMSWEGLDCPPMDDYAFNFGDLNAIGGGNLDPDVFFDEPIKEKKPAIVKKYGKGKELKRLAIVLKQDIDPVAYSRALALEKAELDKEEATICMTAADDKVISCNKSQPIVIKRKIPQTPPMKPEKKVLSRPEVIRSDHHQGCLTKKVLPNPVAYSNAFACEKAELENEKVTTTIFPAADGHLTLWNNTHKLEPIRNREAQPLPMKQEKLHNRPQMISPDHCQGYCMKKVLTKEEEKDHALKLDAAKRKLRESYEWNTNYKKQRSIQLIEFQHLPPMSKPIIQKQKPKTKPRTLAVRNTWSSRLVKV